MRSLLPGVFVLALGCLPSARLEPATPQTSPTTPAIPDTKQMSYALVPWPVSIYAQRGFGYELVIEPDPDSAPLADGLAVEILDDDPEGWWRVRTLQAIEAEGLGLSAEAGLELVVITGWISVDPHNPRIPRNVVEVPSTRPLATTARARVERSRAPTLVVERGRTLVWPDDTEAGVAVYPHAYFTDGETVESPVSPGRELTCYSEREAAGLYRLFGPLCYRADERVDASADDPREPEPEHEHEPGHEPVAIDPIEREALVTLTHAEASGISSSIVRRFVRDHNFDFARCYYGGLRDAPALEGELVLELEVDAQGGVADVAVVADELEHAGTVECMADATRALRLVKPDGGHATVRLEFSLEPRLTRY